MRSRANPRQQRRSEAAANEFWCSWGRHHTRPYPAVKEQYAGGTICLECQVEIMGNLEKAVYMPELSEAMKVRARMKWEQERAQAVAAAPLRRANPDVEGIVYYIRINGQVKIGYTKNLRSRSRAYPPGSELLAVEPGTRETERERHSLFSRDLAQGREWFHESDALTEHIAALVAEFGRPTELMHRYKAHEAARKVPNG